MEEVNNSLFQSIDEENIEVLVREFYHEILEDSLLAPFFIDKLGEDIQSKQWEEHLLLLIEFWKFVALGYENYNGSPLQPHFHIKGINTKAFTRWLILFHQTVDKFYIPSTGEYFKNKSDDIAQNFIRKLNLEGM